MLSAISPYHARRNLKRYGKKTEGLAWLEGVRRVDGLKYSIPQGFVQPVGTHLDNHRSRIGEAYHILTRDITQPTVILARSSAVNEAPGKYETHESLFDPSDPYLSFSRYLAACYKVLQSGLQMAVIAQVMVGGGRGGLGRESRRSSVSAHRMRVLWQSIQAHRMLIRS